MKWTGGWVLTPEQEGPPDLASVSMASVSNGVDVQKAPSPATPALLVRTKGHPLNFLEFGIVVRG